MDSIDEKIIQILQKDGRISMQKLAKELPMSVPATCDRVRKLEDYGVIEGYSAVVDYTKVGKSINAFILCSLRIGELSSNIRWVQRTPAIVSAYVCVRAVIRCCFRLPATTCRSFRNWSIRSTPVAPLKPVSLWKTSKIRTGMSIPAANEKIMRHRK